MATAARPQLDPSALGPRSAELAAYLRQHIVGQEDAIGEIVAAYVKWSAGLCSPDRPAANLLFTGPSGVGKTLAVEMLAEALLHNRRAMIKIDCAEYQHSHEIAKLTGSPPGYIGHRETTPLLTQDALDRYHTPDVPLSFVLFDEIEKASDSLWNLLLGILDKGILTLGDNRKVDFSKALIFMTSNMGSREIESILNPKLGFSPTVPKSSTIQAAGLKAVRKRLTPEFRNRLDKMIVFHPLSEDQIRAVLEVEIDRLNGRIRASSIVTPTGPATARRKALPAVELLQMSEAAKSRLVTDGYQPEFGARHLKRALNQHILHPLARLVDSGQVQLAAGFFVDYDAEASAFRYYA